MIKHLILLASLLNPFSFCTKSILTANLLADPLKPTIVQSSDKNISDISSIDNEPPIGFRSLTCSKTSETTSHSNGSSSTRTTIICTKEVKRDKNGKLLPGKKINPKELQLFNSFFIKK